MDGATTTSDAAPRASARVTSSGNGMVDTFA
jgi:hypothetical protein